MREAVGERRHEAGIALDDVGIVEDEQVIVRDRRGAQRRGDRPRLQQEQPLALERPFDVLRRRRSSASSLQRKLVQRREVAARSAPDLLGLLEHGARSPCR